MPEVPLLYPAPEHAGQTPGITRTTLRRTSRLGPVLCALAAALGVAAIGTFRWYRDALTTAAGGTPTRFADLDVFLHRLAATAAHTPAAAGRVELGLAPAYFHWLVYALLGATVGLTALGTVPSRFAVPLRVLGALAAVATIAATLRAVELYTVHGPLAARQPADTPSGYLDWVRHSGPGAWAMLAAALLCLVAAVVPARRIGRAGH